MPYKFDPRHETAPKFYEKRLNTLFNPIIKSYDLTEAFIDLTFIDLTNLMTSHAFSMATLHYEKTICMQFLVSLLCCFL